MATFAVYELSTGRIVRTGTCPPHMAAIQAVGEKLCGVLTNVAPDVTDVDHYVDLATHLPIDRPSISMPDMTLAPVVISMAGWPSGCTVRATNEALEVAETSDPLDPVEMLEAGAYTVRVTAPFPYKNLKLEVTLA